MDSRNLVNNARNTLFVETDPWLASKAKSHYLIWWRVNWCIYASYIMMFYWCLDASLGFEYIMVTTILSYTNSQWWEMYVLINRTLSDTNQAVYLHRCGNKKEFFNESTITSIWINLHPTSNQTAAPRNKGNGCMTHRWNLIKNIFAFIMILII